MSDPLIINARRELGLGRRLLSDAGTALLWAVWLCLWLPAVHKLQQVIHLHLRFEPAALEVLETVDPIEFSHSVVPLAGTCLLLWLWTLLPRRAVVTAHEDTSLDSYAAAAGVGVDALTRARDSRIAVVHHDDDGNIVGIDCRQ